MKKYSVVSLFCGAGGLDLGFEQQGFHTVWANDIDIDSCDTHRAWSQTTVVPGDIGKIKFSEVPKADVVLGGFPCQGFSLAGPRKINDSRNSLYRHFVDLLQFVNPKVFVAENVKGLLTLGEGKIIEAIVSDFASKGYFVQYKLLNASDYGVPQDRFRVVMVGIRKDCASEFSYPVPRKKKTTLKEALAVLGKPKVADICMAPFSSRYMSRNRRRDWDEVSFTIPAMAKQCPLHPSSPQMIKMGADQWKFGLGETRRFSWREAAAIQTFPKNLEFAGDLVSKYKQIGNAVPVKLAEAIAKELYKTLARI